MPAGAGTAAGLSSGGGYVVAVVSERSVADADAVFRSLQAKFPNQLGGREPIMRRTDLGPEGTYYQASIGPFVSRKAAAGVCSSLKAAGESCLVEKN
jgi:SPOR domain